MGSSISPYQLLLAMSDDDFAFLKDYSPESIDHMCISLTVELLEKEREKPN